MTWWKEYDLELGQWTRWRIGPLDLFAYPIKGEWIFGWDASGDPLDDSLVFESPASIEPDEEQFLFSRYTSAFDVARLSLSALLADRAFVVRPELPLFLPAGEKTTLYVSTPVCVLGSSGENGRNRFFEVPSFRASDTWFGRDTCEGELCYATRTHARTDLSTIGVRPHRAVTPLEITNEGHDVLPIEQLRVPLPALSLYEDTDGRLWTDTVSLVRKEDETSAAMALVGGGPRQESAGRTLLAKPRRPVEPGTIISAFSRLLD